MYFTSNYDKFKEAGYASRDLYNATYDIDPYEKMSDKKEVFGYSQ